MSDWKRRLAESAALTQAMVRLQTGEGLRELTDLSEIRSEVERDGSRVFLSLRWGEEVNQLVTEGLHKERVLFFNPKESELTTGTLLGGDDDTPLRQVETDGYQSIRWSAICTLWREGLLRADCAKT